MSTPAFLSELLEEETLERVKKGAAWGFVMNAVLVVFVVIFRWQGFVGDVTPLLTVFIPLDLAANAFMWWALTSKRIQFFAICTNYLADIVLLTAIVYYTGGPASPLASLYLLVLGVIAALSSAGITFATAALMVLAYATMLVAITLEWVPLTPPLLHNVSHSTGTTWTVVVLEVLKLAAMLVFMAGAISGTVRTLREKEAEVRQKNLDLLEAGRLKSEFVANMTHELRTPIHGVLGLTEMLEDGIYGDLNTKQSVALENINRSATGLLDMVDDLLSLERVESGHLSIKIVQADIHEILKNAADTARWMAGTKDLEITTNVAPDLHRLLTDATLLDHILVNLVSNAVKFTPEGGWVRLNASVRDRGTLVVEVEDNGIGISDEQRQRVFEAFRQVDASSSRQYGGAGLGLTVVSRLSDLLGATVDFESTLGEGTVFRVSVPNSVISSAPSKPRASD